MRKAKTLLISEQGRKLCGLRCAEVENVFGQIKWDRGFDRFRPRALPKLSLEWGLVCITHNLLRMAALQT
ncbi:MAG: transposase [Flexilinea sp.]